MIDATRPRPVRHPSAPSATAHDNQGLAAAAAALTPTPPGRALFGTDTSGLAQSYILYSGREVLLPIGAFLGNVLSPGSGHAAGRHQPALGGLRRRSAGLVLRFSRLLPGHSRIVPRAVGENLRVPGQISPMRATYHRRQAAGVSKAHRGEPAMHVYNSRAREPGSPCPGPSPIGSAARRQPTCRGTEVSGQVQRAGGGGQA